MSAHGLILGILMGLSAQATPPDGPAPPPSTPPLQDLELRVQESDQRQVPGLKLKLCSVPPAALPAGLPPTGALLLELTLHRDKLTLRAHGTEVEAHADLVACLARDLATLTLPADKAPLTLKLELRHAPTLAPPPPPLLPDAPAPLLLRKGRPVAHEEPPAD